MLTNQFKCPNCGSTAQPHLQSKPIIKDDNTIVQKFECGCGCSFSAVYKLTEIYTTFQK